MTIAQAVDWWATQVTAITGIVYSTGVPKEAIGTNNPFFVCFDSSAVLTTESAGQKRDLYTIRGLLLLQRGDLESAINVLRGKPVAIADKVRTDPTMGGYVSTFDQITYQFSMAIEWMGIAYIGYVIDITGVKIRS